MENLSFSYKNRVALKKINLSIDKGDAVAILGANGSGKSTLLKIMNGLIFATDGNFYFENESITAKKLRDNSYSKKFHKKVGFVFQNSDAQLFCSTVYDEIAFGPRQIGLHEEEVKIRVRDCMKLLNIEELSDIPPYNLSGGEKKRVAIASVLSMNPDVLVFDEPMNGLDPKTKKFLLNFIATLNQNGKTIICATHEFNGEDGIFNKAIVFSEDHTVVEIGDYSSIIKNRKLLMENNII